FDDGHARAAVGQKELVLGGRHERVDRHRDGAELGRAPECRRERGRVVQRQHHAMLDLHAEAGQAVGAAVDRRGEIGVADAAPGELQWWSHWAIEDSKKAVLFEAKRRFEAANPGHTVTITFYEKKNMWPALRAAFTAGSGFPDVFYYDMDVPEFITAGWLADLSNGVRWQNIEPFGKAFWTRPGPGGKTGTWAIPVEAASDEIYYNRKMFKELGITVPAN